MAESAICSIDGCDKPAKIRGWCEMHYRRWRQHGDPTVRLIPMAPKGEPSRALTLIALTSNTDDCVTWPYAKHSTGYGVVYVKRRPIFAHRSICAIAHGPPPTADHEAAHSCGKGHEACVNPRHLRWATHAENMADKFLHGTNPRGGDNGYSKLTSDAVLQIVTLRNEMSPLAMADRFAVSRRAIYDVLGGKTWQHITGFSRKA